MTLERKAAANYVMCEIHKKRFPQGGECPDCLKEKADRDQRRMLNEQALNYLICQEHNLRYPAGGECPKCKEKK